MRVGIALMHWGSGQVGHMARLQMRLLVACPMLSSTHLLPALPVHYRKLCHRSRPPVAQDPWGHPAQGWAGQAAILSRKYANVSLADRLPQAMWRGRIKDERYPQRDALRWVWGGWVGGRWWTRWAAGNLLG